MTHNTYSFSNYIKNFGTDIIIKDDENIIGIINLYNRAINKKEIILSFLTRKYGNEYSFRGDFFAGLNRIEFYRR